MGRIDERTENAAIRDELAALAAQLDGENDDKEEKREKTKRFLTAACAGCGARIEVTSPQTHVVSDYTGAAYCATCAVEGLPPIEKRPEWNPVRATSHLPATERARVERTKVSTTETEASPVFDELIERVKAEIPGVTLDPKKGYVTLKVDGKTIGYVNGKKKIRIDGIVVAGKQEKLTITESSEVAKGLALLQSNAATQAEKATARAAATSEKKPAAKKSSSKKKSSAPVAGQEIDLDAPISSDKDVVPDPKPTATRKRTSRAKKS